MPELTKAQALRLLTDELPALMDKPDVSEAVIAAVAGNEEAMQRALRSAGLDVREAGAIGTTDLLNAHGELVRHGAIDGGFGKTYRARSPYVMRENPLTGRKERTYIFGEAETLAEAWLRAFLAKDWRDRETGKDIHELREELERMVRAPADPFLQDVGGAGAALVPTLVAAQIFEEMNERFVLKDFVTMFTVAGKLNIPRREVQATVTRGGTATDIAEDIPETKPVSLSPDRAAVLSYIDPRLAAAAAVGPVRWVTGQLAEAMAKDDQRAILVGTGAGGDPEGVLTLPTADANPFNNINTNAWVATNNASRRDAIRKAYYAVSQRHREGDNFKWVANSDVIQVLASLNDTDQRPFQDERYNSKDVVEASAIPTDGTPESTLLGGDWRQYAWAEHPSGLRLEATTIGGDAWESDTVGVKAVQYVDGAPIIPGAFTKVTAVDV